MSKQLQIGGCFINFTRKESFSSTCYPLKETYSLPLFNDSDAFSMNSLNDDIHYVCVICIRNLFTSFDFIYTLYILT